MSAKSHRRTFLKQSALLGGGLLLLGTTRSQAAETNSPSAPKTPPAPDAGSPNATADIREVFKYRRSVRKFRPDPVPEADIRKIIDAARLAPTSGNQQPWKFLVIRDKDKISQMKEACVKRVMERNARENEAQEAKEKREAKVRSRLDGIFSAPAYVVVLTDNQSQYPDYNHWDGPLAAGYLLLAARALGYGTVHITDVIPDSVTKEVLRIPDRFTRVCITPVGIPIEWPKSPKKKKLEEFIAWETPG